MDEREEIQNDEPIPELNLSRLDGLSRFKGQDFPKYPELPERLRISSYPYTKIRESKELPQLPPEALDRRPEEFHYSDKVFRQDLNETIKPVPGSDLEREIQAAEGSDNTGGGGKE
jgi:hypothetical protein